MLLIYSQHITNRVEYTFDHLLNHLSGIQFELTGDRSYYLNYEGPSINYSFEKIKESEVHLPSNGLLYSNEVFSLETSVQKQKGRVFFYFNGPGIDVKIFDRFAASFYLLSRYEEYFPYQPDIHNRFEAASSVLHKHSLLNVPLVDQWAGEIKELILERYPSLSFSQTKKISALITIDIDQAFAFKARGLKRNVLSFFKNISTANFKMTAEQLKLVFHLNEDPFDSYKYLKQQQEAYSLPFIYFINAGRYGKYDKNLSLKNKRFLALLKKIGKHADLGLHPSYYSNEVPQKFIEEKNALENLTSKKIEKSRQHFLKLYFPSTYRHLIEAGIKEDYSMGYASFYGFRAGTCNSFFWFDLEKNSKTPLKVFPVSYMDGTFMESLKLSPEKSIIVINDLIKNVKQYSGVFIPIWHNHTVSDRLFWRNWRAVFEATLQAF